MQVLMIHTTKNVATRLAVRAFAGPQGRVAQLRPFVARFQSTAEVEAGALSANAANDDAATATTDDDLDAVLDSVLGEAMNTPGASTDFLEKSKPVPEKPVIEVDFKDPKFLSVTNPHWVNSGLDKRIVDLLSEKGITKFTPVQGEAFGPILAGQDVIGRSRTGTGKTLAFGLPAMTRLVKIMKENGTMNEQGRARQGRKTSMIVLCPTRELARQVQEELRNYANPLGLFTEVFHGGVSYDPQARALRNGLDILVGTPGRVIDHLQRGNLDLSECNTVVLDEADEMLNMGFADDVETILQGVGSANEEKTQCLLFSATTPPWVKQIGRQYQQDVVSIDATAGQEGARTATTVRHTAVQLPPGKESKMAILEDIIAVEISKEKKPNETDFDVAENPIAAAAAERKKKSHGAMQQKIFGKTIVFTETKRDADEMVSGGVFKSLSAMALHGDVGQKQRDATLAAFRQGAFNVLVATDVAARGIDIQDVDLVVQFDPPRDVDTYVHRSGRTGRAGNSGVSVLLFSPSQQRDIVRIERDLGHDFKFELVGPPSTEAALKAAAKTSAIACQGVPDETAEYFMDSAKQLLEDIEDPAEIVARCLAAISRRASSVQSRSLLTGELGFATVEMSNSQGRPVEPRDVMFTVGKLSRMSQTEGDLELAFDSDVGKIQGNPESGTAIFDMGVEDAKKLVEFSKGVSAGGAVFELLKELEVERDHNFGRGGGGRGGGGRFSRGGGGGRGGYPGGRGGGSYGGGGGGRYERGGGGGRYGGGRESFGPRGGRGPGFRDRVAGDRNGYSSGGDMGSRGGYQRRYDSSPPSGNNDGW